MPEQEHYSLVIDWSRVVAFFLIVIMLATTIPFYILLASSQRELSSCNSDKTAKTMFLEDTLKVVKELNLTYQKLSEDYGNLTIFNGRYDVCVIEKNKCSGDLTSETSKGIVCTQDKNRFADLTSQCVDSINKKIDNLANLTASINCSSNATSNVTELNLYKSLNTTLTNNINIMTLNFAKAKCCTLNLTTANYSISSNNILCSGNLTVTC